MVRVSKRENDAEDEDVVHGPPRCCELTERAANRLLSSQSCSSSTRPPTGGARALVCCRQILVLSTPKTDSFRIVIPIPSCRKSIDLFLNTTLLLLFFNFFSTFDYCVLDAMSSIEEQEARAAQPMPTTPLHLSTHEEKVDTWSTREKLVLALSVATRGDQNWTGFRQTIKHYAEKDRPVDFFSNRSCATQYRKMLEEIEAPKRRREKKEDKKGRSAEEVPQELIIKKCKDEHLAELGNRIKAQITEYCENLAIIEKIKSGNYDKKWYAEICKQVKREIELKKQKEQQQQAATAQPPPPTTPVKSALSSAETVQPPATPTVSVAQAATTGDSVDASQLNDKTGTASVGKDETIPTPKATVVEPVTSPRITRSPEKAITSPSSSLPKLNSPPAAVLPRLKSPVKASQVVEDVKSEQPKLLPVLQDAKDELADKTAVETASGGTLKTDTDEGKSVATTTTSAAATSKEVAVVEKAKKEPPTTEVTKSAIPTPLQSRNIIALEHENSNDTIEEMEVDSVPVKAVLKTESQLKETTKAGSKAIDPVKQETPAVSKDVTAKAAEKAIVAETAATPVAAASSKTEEAAPKGVKRKEPSTEGEEPKLKAAVSTPAESTVVKKEEESSVANPIPASTLEGSTTKTTEESTESSTPATPAEPPAKRKSRSRVPKTPSSMNTRSTRSQTQIKVEQKDASSTTPVSAGRGGGAERASSRGASTSSKRNLSNSIDDTSLDNVYSEESSDVVGTAAAAAAAAANSTENDSTDTSDPAPVPIDNFWRRAALKVMTTIQANKHSGLFATEKSEASMKVRDYGTRLIDLNSIKKRINDGHIRDWVGLENAVCAMYNNVYMLHPINHPMSRAARAMEEMVVNQIKQSVTQPARRPGRPSARLSTPALATPEVQVKVDRRKTRGSISVEKPAGSKKR